MTELRSLAENILSYASDDEEVEIVIGTSTETEIVTYNGEVESLTQANTAAVGIRVIWNHGVGFASTGTLDKATLLNTLKMARETSRIVPPDEIAGLASPDGLRAASLRLVAPEFATTSLERKINLALELERTTKARDPRIKDVQHSTYADSASEFIVATTTGIASETTRTTCYLFAEAIAAAADDIQTGWSYHVGRHAQELDLERVATEASGLALRMLGAHKPKSQRIAVVLDPRMTASFLSLLGGALSAENVQRGRSMFCDRMGESIAASIVSLIDNPTDPRLPNASPYDGEGLASRSNTLIVDGVLSDLLYDSYSARRAERASNAAAVRGVTSTPSPGARALQLTPGPLGASEIISRIDDGILVQSMSGLHSGASTVSGDFSVGIEGIRITKGTLGEPVREATISSTLQRMFLGVSAVGNDVVYLPGNAAGQTLVIDEMALAGQ
ncbi:MAG: TldD/PmbA family protein [Ferrimicrobium sp.]